MFDGTQLDLIYLIGVLALFLIGALTPMLNRRTNRLLPWSWLGMFAFFRGGHDCLNLPALNQLIPGYFELLSFVLLFLSLIFLMEFGRAGSKFADRPVPWVWVYIPLAGLMLLGKLLGLANLSSVVSFSVSTMAGAWAAWALLQASPKLPQGKETLTAAAIIMFLYGIASCFILSSESFMASVGVPIHLVQGLLAIGLAACLFRICQNAADPIKDLRAQRIYQYLTHGAFISLMFIAAVGVVGSLEVNYLSNNAVREALTKNQNTILRIQEIINNEMEKADRLVQLLAGSSRVLNSLIMSNDGGQIVQANEVLDRYSQTEESYGVCYLMNLSGVTIASSNRNQSDSFVGKNYGFRPYFKQAALGLQGRYYALGVTSKDLGYYASAPIRNAQGAIVGVAVIKRVIRTSGELKNAFDPGSAFFLVDPHGIVVLSNTSKLVLSSLWPLTEETRKELLTSGQFGGGPFSALLEQKPLEGKEYQLEGKRMVALTQPIMMEGWTIFHFGSAQDIPFYKLMGSAAILALGFALIGFYVSWDLASYKTAGMAASDPSETGDLVSYRQIEEKLQQNELKYQELAQNISLMSAMGDLLQSCTSFRDAIPVITKYMQRLFPDLSGGIYLSSVGDTFEVMGVWGESPPEEQLFALDDCWALRRGRHYLVEDTDDSLPCQHLPQKIPAGYQCWPIASQGKTLGVLHLRQSRLPDNPRPISEQQKEINQQLISSVVEQFTMTLVSLKLRESSQAKALLHPVGR